MGFSCFIQQLRHSQNQLVSWFLLGAVSPILIRKVCVRIRRTVSEQNGGRSWVLHLSSVKRKHCRKRLAATCDFARWLCPCPNMSILDPTLLLFTKCSIRPQINWQAFLIILHVVKKRTVITKSLCEDRLALLYVQAV